MTAVDLSKVRPILLIETFIAGLFAHDRKAVVALQSGQLLKPVREPDNVADPRAIALETSDGVRVGYVPKSENTLLANLMDGGKRLEMRVADVSSHGPRLSVELHVFLRD